jgi:hypothetical protein
MFRASIEVANGSAKTAKNADISRAHCPYIVLRRDRRQVATMNALTARPLLFMGTLFIAVAACSGVVESPDEGAGGQTEVAVCSSNVKWTELDKGSALMRPGGKCKACHEKNKNAPIYDVSGTVYPTLHEPDDCNGVASKMSSMGVPDVAVVITDGADRTLPPIPVNSAGNFYLPAAIPPYSVKVIVKGKENKMAMKAPHGDCNACHTQAGTTTVMGGPVAPGRVTLPPM